MATRSAVADETASGSTGGAAAPAPVAFEYLPDRLPNAEIQLGGGITVKADAWRTLLIADLKLQKLDDGRLVPVTCTASLVGPGVILTAAHCFDDGPGFPLRTTFTFKIGGQTLSGNCKVSDQYQQAVDAHYWNFQKPRVSEDYALCAFAMPAVVPAALQALAYEVVDETTPLNSGDAVLMTGFGCADVAIDDSGKITFAQYDNQLRVGNAAIGVAPGIAAPQSTFAQIFSASHTQPALCPGDSGGPLLSGVTAADQTRSRRLRGVNSGIAPGQDGGRWRLVSSVAALGTNAFRSFTAAWLGDPKNKGKMICGLGDASAAVPPCAD